MRQCVCILTAGRGTRMNDLGKNLNKALLPINQKAAISWIIEKFPTCTQFVIATGYKGDQVREFLSLAYPAIEFDFVEVENFDQPGSGPGKSLLACREHLQRPFYFVSCDTLWHGEIQAGNDQDWLAVASVEESDTNRYCNIEIVDDNVLSLKDKSHVSNKNYKAFTGLAFVRNFRTFWEGLSQEILVDGEHQVSNGIQALIAKHKIGVCDIDWIDVGDESKYLRALKLFERYDFGKQNEQIYFCDGRVVKYFTDKNIASKRVQRARLNPRVFPEILYLAGNFYSYQFIPGATLYKQNDPVLFNKLLDWLDAELWCDVDTEPNKFTDLCNDFYLRKSYVRLDAFDRKHPNFDRECFINGEIVPSARTLLGLVDWKLLRDGLPSFIHGDLQFDNIIYNPQIQEFTLIDWRQDFAGEVEYGDRFYDFAKLLAGIIVNYDLIKLALMNFREDGNEVFFDFAKRYGDQILSKLLKCYIEKKGYEFLRIELLAGLIFINMAPLHHYPFDKLLLCLGRQTLKVTIAKQAAL